MSFIPGCGCGNWWNNLPRSVCGGFTEPTIPDTGRCAPYRVKTTCEAPTKPVPQCSDDQYTTVYDPQNPENPFYVVARVFDENCDAILDSNGQPILTIIS